MRINLFAVLMAVTIITVCMCIVLMVLRPEQTDIPGCVGDRYVVATEELVLPFTELCTGRHVQVRIRYMSDVLRGRIERMRFLSRRDQR